MPWYPRRRRGKRGTCESSGALIYYRKCLEKVASRVPSERDFIETLIYYRKCLEKVASRVPSERDFQSDCMSVQPSRGRIFYSQAQMLGANAPPLCTRFWAAVACRQSIRSSTWPTCCRGLPVAYACGTCRPSCLRAGQLRGLRPPRKSLRSLRRKSGRQELTARETGCGPADGHGRGQKLFEDISSLPRRQQEKVFEFVEAIVDQYRRKAS